MTSAAKKMNVIVKMMIMIVKTMNTIVKTMNELQSNELIIITEIVNKYDCKYNDFNKKALKVLLFGK